jgi:hypothetical protein
MSKFVSHPKRKERSRISENKALKRIFRLQGEEGTEVWKELQNL